MKNSIPPGDGAHFLAVERRVYRPEFQQLLGFGLTWFRKLEQQGRIPPARVDPHGRRRFWTAAEVHAAVKKLNAQAEVAVSERSSPVKKSA